MAKPLVMKLLQVLLTTTGEGQGKFFILLDNLCSFFKARFIVVYSLV